MKPEPIDQWFPPRGQCQICGVPGADQRHRVIEAIADAVNAGDGEEDVARDYDVPVEAVEACVRWAAEHPDGIERDVVITGRMGALRRSTRSARRVRVLGDEESREEGSE